MSFEETLQRRLERLEKWSRKCDLLLEREAGHLEDLYRRTLAEWETRKWEISEALLAREIQTKAEVEQAGKDYAKRKYQIEREMNGDKEAVKHNEIELRDLQKKGDVELRHLNEEKLNIQISHDRQVSALNDLYQEKRRHLAVTRAGLQREWQVADEKLRDARQKSHADLNELSTAGEAKVLALREQGDAKRNGWNLALDTMKKQMEGFSQEKIHLEKRVGEIRGEKEKELEALRTGMAVAREQLEVDKATLIEKAEEDQRTCEREIEDLRKKTEEAERDLQNLVVNHEQTKKDLAQKFEQEETALKDSLREETEQRDYEHKLFEQEKTVKEKEVLRLREEYEKKKWQWDNQVRSLLMQKTLQDSEHQAERLRTDRGSRTELRSLEAKRDELKQRLADVKNRHTVLSANAQKEHDLISQRWNWRKERLWTLWQSRLDVVRKERKAIQEQLEALQEQWTKERRRLDESQTQENSRLNDLQSQVLGMVENVSGQKRQREIQFELEKTRILAQIKECETLISEWMERLRQTQEQVTKANSQLASQTQFLDRWYRDEEGETQLFLKTLQSVSASLQEALISAEARRAA